jgi:hypothetical protein
MRLRNGKSIVLGQAAQDASALDRAAPAHLDTGNRLYDPTASAADAAGHCDTYCIGCGVVLGAENISWTKSGLIARQMLGLGLMSIDQVS